MLPVFMLEIRYYVAEDGHQPFAEWFADLDPVARAKVARAIARMEQGNLSNVKPSARACWNIRSISGRDTGSISRATGRHC